MKNYVELNMDTILVSLYNSGEENNKIYVNDKDFFANTFESEYDAAWAVSLSGKWAWSDDYVYFDNDGYITSFSHWDDETSPIDKIDINDLIQNIKKQHKNGYVVNNVPRAIHDALQKDDGRL